MTSHSIISDSQNVAEWDPPLMFLAITNGDTTAVLFESIL